MSVWKCPHCTSVQIIMGEELSDFQCSKLNCGAILDKLDEPDAGRAMREAFYCHDHRFSPAIVDELARVRSVNAGLKRIVKALEADEIGDAPCEHSVRPRDPGHKVTVGWNPALETFFLRVIRRKDGGVVAHQGTKTREIIDIIDLKKRAHRYAYFNNALIEQLRADRDAGQVSS